MRIVGLDIGGANIKIASTNDATRCESFPLWKQRDDLSEKLVELAVGPFADPQLVALTMTAELADCFETKAEGVEFIIRAVQTAFPAALVRVWMTSGEFAEPDDAIELPGLVAAANWHVLATWAGRAVPSGPALLIDVGSTTTDIIPILDGHPLTCGTTDAERLVHSELVYTGARRTPVCAVVRTIICKGLTIPVAAEVFATTLDVHLINGDISEQPQNCGTADGRPALRKFSLNRMAHMMCCDREELPDEHIQQMAAYVAEQQLQQISAAVQDRLSYLERIARPDTATDSDEQIAAANTRHLSIFQAEECVDESDSGVTILLSGSGAFLARKVLAQIDAGRIAQVLDLSKMYGGQAAEAACAFAAARLAADRCLDDLLPIGEHL